MPELVLGRGKLFFGEVFGDVEFYMGSSSQFLLSYSVDLFKTYKSENGIIVTDDVYIRSSEMTASCDVDDIKTENMARYFGSTTDRELYSPVSDFVESKVLRRGGYYQLGVSPAFPYGAKNIMKISVAHDGTTLLPDIDYRLSVEHGVLHILDRSLRAVDGVSMTITFSAGGSTPTILKPGSNFAEGCIRYQEDNHVGKNRTFVFPHAKLVPSGEDLDMKADTWRRLSMDIEVTGKGPTGLPLFIVENVLLNDYGMPDLSGVADDHGNLTLENPAFIDDYGVNRNG